MLIDDVVISQYDDVALYLLRDALRPSRRRNRQPYRFAVINRQQKQHRRQNRRETNDSSSNRHLGATTIFFPFTLQVQLNSREGQRSSSLRNQTKPNQTQRQREFTRACVFNKASGECFNVRAANQVWSKDPRGVSFNGGAAFTFWPS